MNRNVLVPLFMLIFIFSCLANGMPKSDLSIDEVDCDNFDKNERSSSQKSLFFISTSTGFRNALSGHHIINSAPELRSKQLTIAAKNGIISSDYLIANNAEIDGALSDNLHIKYALDINKPVIIQNIDENQFTDLVGISLGSGSTVLVQKFAHNNYLLAQLHDNETSSLREEDFSTLFSYANSILNQERSASANSVYPFSEAFYDLTLISSTHGQLKPRDDKSQTANVFVRVEVKVVASIRPYYKKYVFIKQKGTSFDPGELEWNESDDRGYFNYMCKVKVKHSGSASIGVNLDEWAPKTENAETTYISSTGFTYSANTDIGAEVSGGGITQGYGVSYNNTNTTSHTVKDFVVTADSETSGGQPSVEFTYKLGDVNGWRDMTESELVGWSVKELPELASGELNAENEVVFTVPGDYEGTTKFKVETFYEIWNVWCDGFGDTKRNKRGATTSPSKEFRIDFSKVVYPHLGIGESAKSSSVWNGNVASRAFDGFIEGQFHYAETSCDSHPYVEVDLGESKTIGEVEVFSVTDVSSLTDNLMDYYILLSDNPFPSNSNFVSEVIAVKEAAKERRESGIAATPEEQEEEQRWSEISIYSHPNVNHVSGHIFSTHRSARYVRLTQNYIPNGTNNDCILAVAEIVLHPQRRGNVDRN